jgi:hypothetical protein
MVTEKWSSGRILNRFIILGLTWYSVYRDQEYDDCFNRAFNFGFECFWENYCPWYGGHCPCPGGDGTNCGNGEWTGCKAGQAAAQNAKCGGPIW